MIATIILVSLALAWLARETRWFTVRLPIGKDKPRYGVGRTMAQWDEYNKAHSTELKKEREEYAERQVVIKSHTCDICHTHNDSLLVETKTITAGKSSTE